MKKSFPKNMLYVIPNESKRFCFSVANLQFIEYDDITKVISIYVKDREAPITFGNSDFGIYDSFIKVLAKKKW